MSCSHVHGPNSFFNAMDCSSSTRPTNKRAESVSDNGWGGSLLRSADYLEGQLRTMAASVALPSHCPSDKLTDHRSGLPT